MLSKLNFVKVVVSEPQEEIENSVIAEESNVREINAEKFSIISVIPMKSFNMSDDDLKKANK